MKYSRLGLFCSLLMLFTPPLWSQKGEGYNDMATPQVRSGKLEAPQHLQKYVVDGKLKLSLQDAVVLTLENNSFVRIQETQVEFSKFSLLGAHSPFDPVVSAFYNVNSISSPPFSHLQGTGGASTTFNSTTQDRDSSTTPKHLRPARTYRPDLAATTISPTTRSIFSIPSSRSTSEFSVHAAAAAKRLAVCQSGSAGNRAAQSGAVASQLCGAK